MEAKEVLEILKKIKPAKNFEGVDKIVEEGYLDSFELMALITTLSDDFGVEIPFDRITPENFNSAEAIAAMVTDLKAGK